MMRSEMIMRVDTKLEEIRERCGRKIESKLPYDLNNLSFRGSRVDGSRALLGLILDTALLEED
jgi:hypothetical protein